MGTPQCKWDPQAGGQASVVQCAGMAVSLCLSVPKGNTVMEATPWAQAGEAQLCSSGGRAPVWLVCTFPSLGLCMVCHHSSVPRNSVSPHGLHRVEPRQKPGQGQHRAGAWLGWSQVSEAGARQRGAFLDDSAVGSRLRGPAGFPAAKPRGSMVPMWCWPLFWSLSQVQASPEWGEGTVCPGTSFPSVLGHPVSVFHSVPTSSALSQCCP